MGDLVRGSLESVPKHQYESGRAIGLTERQIFFYIIIPQTLRSLIPLSMNLITRMIKTTSLVVFVGVIEVVKIGQQIIEANRIKIPTASIAVYAVLFCLLDIKFNCQKHRKETENQSLDFCVPLRCASGRYVRTSLTLIPTLRFGTASQVLLSLPQFFI